MFGRHMCRGLGENAALASYLRPHDVVVNLNGCIVETTQDFVDCALRVTAAPVLPAPPSRPLYDTALEQPLQAGSAVEGAVGYGYGGAGAWTRDLIADAARRRQPHRGFCAAVQLSAPVCRAVPGKLAEAACGGSGELCFTSLSLQNDSARSPPFSIFFRAAGLLCATLSTSLLLL